MYGNRDVEEDVCAYISDKPKLMEDGNLLSNLMSRWTMYF